MNPAYRRPVGAAVLAVAAAVATPFAWRTEPARVETVETDDTAQPAAPAPGSGRALFQARGCAGCHHGPDAGGNRGNPDLTDAAAWAGERRDGYTAEEYLAESMRDPGAFTAPEFASVGGSGMPDLGLTEPEIDALVDHLLSE